MKNHETSSGLRSFHGLHGLHEQFRSLFDLGFSSTAVPVLWIEKAEAFFDASSRYPKWILKNCVCIYIYMWNLYIDLYGFCMYIYIYMVPLQDLYEHI